MVCFWILSRLKRPNPREYSHQDCPETRCTAANSTLLDGSGRYQPARTRGDDHNCDLVSVDERKVLSIVVKGDIPLVSIHISPAQEVQLDVRAVKPSDDFFAISHVWSDGLDNPKANALPEYQLRRLHKYLQELPHPYISDWSQSNFQQYRPIYAFGPLLFDLQRWKIHRRTTSRATLFWFNTLCIPVAADPREKTAHEAKKRTIDQMALIYSQAYQVLVLDAMLLESRVKALHRCELLARISFSNWMGRCWTLQEGTLNQFVFFFSAQTVPSASQIN